MEFLDREKEIELLRDHLTRRKAAMFVLYGRRRIGKTALLDRVLSTLPRTVYHVGTRSTVTEELRRLSEALDRAFADPLLRAQPLSSTPAFLAFLERAPEGSVIALDEFPFLAESDPSFPGLLQAAWDQKLSKGNLKLVLCGSSVGLMESTFLSPRAPLFGRRTGQLRLGPLPVRVLIRAFPWRLAQVVELAALFGGVPGYLQRLDPDRDLMENLRRHVLRVGEPLYEEIPFLLREELREPRVYHGILAVIAGGARRFGEISSKVGLDRANLTRYLSTLIELGLVEREVPVTERRPEKSRKGLYRIADPFVATWFSLVHPYRDLLERDAAAALVDSEILPRARALLPAAVEPVLRELLATAALGCDVPFPVARAGHHWSDTAEFDVVLLDQDRERAFVAEVKWSLHKVSPDLLDDLRRRVAAEVSLAGLACTLALVSRGGFLARRRVAADERLVDLSRSTLL